MGQERFVAGSLVAIEAAARDRPRGNLWTRRWQGNSRGNLGEL